VTDNEGRRLLLLNGRQIRRAGTIPDAGRKKRRRKRKKRRRKRKKRRKRRKRRS